ncbi:MAG: hypothetical protein V2A79_14895 [Planctomycetota bacterium]
MDAARYIWGIDPGTTESAGVLYDPEAHRIEWHFTGIWPNADLLNADWPDIRATMAIEKIVSYGMSVGQETFDTCVFIGRLVERWRYLNKWALSPILIPRKEIVIALCGTAKAKDPNVRRVLLDLFGGDKAVGTKKAPGPLYGIKTHLWSALAVAVVAAGRAK